MAGEPKTIEVEPGSEVDRLLDEAAEAPLRLVRGQDEFGLQSVSGNRRAILGEGMSSASEDDHKTIARLLEQPPSAEQVARSIEGLRRAAGSWKDIDAEAFKAYIRERRRTSSRRPARW